MDIICGYRLFFMHAGVLSGRKETGNCILENCEHSKIDFIFFRDKQLKKRKESQLKIKYWCLTLNVALQT